MVSAAALQAPPAWWCEAVDARHPACRVLLRVLQALQA
jgi:hypothetical protein